MIGIITYGNFPFPYVDDDDNVDDDADNDDDFDDDDDDDDEDKTVALQVEGTDDEALYGRNYLDWKKQTLTSQVSPLLFQSVTLAIIAQLSISL